MNIFTLKRNCLLNYTTVCAPKNNEQADYVLPTYSSGERRSCQDLIHIPHNLPFIVDSWLCHWWCRRRKFSNVACHCPLFNQALDTMCSPSSWIW